MRIMAGIVAALLLWLPSALAQQKAPPRAKAPPAQLASPEAIQKWINGYRDSPDPQRLPEAVKAMAELGLFREIDSAGLYIGFAAGVLGTNPSSADALVSRMFPLPPEDQVAIVRAIAYSGAADWKDLLSRFIERMPARKVLIDRHLTGKLPVLMELPLDQSPAGIDALWGYYFATGSDEPIRRLVTALAWHKEANNLDKLTAAGMAKLTLAINASRDTDLMRILKAELAQQRKEARVALAEVVEAAETFETGRIRKEALAAIEDLKRKGPASARSWSWWSTAGQTALALGCVAASAMGQVQVGIPCVVGGAASSAALKLFTPGQ